MKDKVILVTGATGQQGGAVARHLLKDGWQVRALVRDPDKDSALALQALGITLVKGDLRGIARARRLSQATMRNIRSNLFLAFGYNILAIPIAAGALYPFTGTLLSPMIASAAMSLSSVSVIVNALRLRRVEL